MGDSILGGARKSAQGSEFDVRSIKSFTVGGGNQTEDFKMFLEDVNDDLFDH
jgi:hypothetical protein